MNEVAVLESISSLTFCKTIVSRRQRSVFAVALGHERRWQIHPRSGGQRGRRGVRALALRRQGVEAAHPPRGGDHRDDVWSRRPALLPLRQGAPKGKIQRLTLQKPELAKAETLVPEREGAIQSMAITASKLYVVDLLGSPASLHDDRRKDSLDDGALGFLRRFGAHDPADDVGVGDERVLVAAEEEHLAVVALDARR